jgi:hypothetical protein
VDLSPLDRTVASFASEHYAPYSFCLHRLPVSANLWRDGAKPDPAAWVERTAAIAAEWKRRGLPPEVYIYGPDEPRPTDYPFLRDLYTRLRETVPGFPIMQTIGDRNPEALVGLVDIWCPLSARADSEFYQDRLRAGDTLWVYVCCSPKPPFANFFVDQPAVDHRVLFWQAHKLGATGVLYWCACWWAGLPTPAASDDCFPETPVDLANSNTYKSYKCNGDGLLMYPGANWTPYSSIRLEVIRDGVEDFEYLGLLAALVEKARTLPPGQRPGEPLLQEAQRLCRVPDSITRTMTDYTKDPQELLDARRRVAETVERLDGLLPSEWGHEGTGRQPNGPLQRRGMSARWAEPAPSTGTRLSWEVRRSQPRGKEDPRQRRRAPNHDLSDNNARPARTE